MKKNGGQNNDFDYDDHESSRLVRPSERGGLSFASLCVPPPLHFYP